MGLTGWLVGCEGMGAGLELGESVEVVREVGEVA